LSLYCLAEVLRAWAELFAKLGYAAACSGASRAAGELVTGWLLQMRRSRIFA
jgi:hypothetical protein